MLKLYRFEGDTKEYWETWQDGNQHTIHWGRLGTKGQSETVKSSFLRPATKKIQAIIDEKVQEGFAPVDADDHRVLIVEYPVAERFASDAELDKRHRLEDQLNDILGWTGLGNCDGGSTGEGTMEACCYVVDFGLAKTVIIDALKGTEFADYSRIFDEDLELD